MDKINTLYNLANKLAIATPDFFEKKGPGKGNHATNNYIKELDKQAINAFGADYSEQRICGDNSLAVDFYFPEEGAIIEIALGIKNPNTEFEKDVLKAVMAQSLGNKVDKLIFISKPGGVRKCNQPGRTAVKLWLEKTHNISIEVYDLG